MVDWISLETPLYRAENLAAVLETIDSLIFDDPELALRRLRISAPPHDLVFVMSEMQHMAFVYAVSTLISSVREAVVVFEATRVDLL